MKIVRNAAFVGLGIVWLITSPEIVRADPNEACDISCSWSGQSCCNVGDLQCGSEGGGQGLCMYCLGLGGGQESSSCSAWVAGEEIQGSVCQCESIEVP